MDIQLSAAARQPTDVAQVSLGRRILRHLHKWPATAAEMVEALAASHEAIHAAVANLEAADLIEMHGKKERGMRIWALREEVPA